MDFIARGSALLAAVVLAGCASAPVSLVALPTAPAPHATTVSAGPTVLLRDVSVPAYLDGFPVVVSRKGSTLVVSRDAEWAERPSIGVTRVLRDALSERLGTSRVLVVGDRRIPDADLAVEFLALDPQPGALYLDARWSWSCAARRGGGAGRTQLEVPMDAATPQAAAAATSEALGRFADALAAIQTECRPFADDLARRGR